MQRIFYISLFIYIFLTGCEPEEGQGPFRPEIAVYSVLTANTFAEARIEYTQDLMDTTAYWLVTQIPGTKPFINPKLICPSAKVALFEKDVPVDSLRYNSTTCLYEGSSHKVEPGGQYRLEIAVKDQPLIYAATTVPFPVEILGLDTVTTSYDEYNNSPVIDIKLTFADPPDENNFYELYCSVLFKYDSINNPFPQYGSISLSLNGIFENLSIYNTNLVYFSDKLFNGETISLKMQPFSRSTGFLDFLDSLICLNLISVSAEKAKYCRSEDRYWYNYNVNNAFSEPVSMYSNIVNGAGIFAGVAESSDTLKFYK
jgi:hypothetical protein